MSGGFGTSVTAHPVAAIPLVMQGIAQVGREPTEGWPATRLAIREMARRIVCIVDVGRGLMDWVGGCVCVCVWIRGTFAKRK